LKQCHECNQLNSNTALICGGCNTNIANELKIEECLKPEDRERFQFNSFIGEGSFGKVYQCHDSKLNKTVALKIIKSECLESKLFLDLFKRECEFSSNIGEEHLVTTIDYFVSSTYSYSVMEYISGVDLNIYLRKNFSISLKNFKKIALQIADGLHFFHYHGLLHCDLKPSNIMINPENFKLKIIDFGLSHFKFEEKLLDKHMVGGTHGYMSPEQESGTKALTASSDIYSVGVIYYEILTGYRPEFYDENDDLITPSDLCDILLSATSRTVFQDMENITNDVLSVISHLDFIILKCLQKEPKNRFKDISELKSAIEKTGIDYDYDIIIQRAGVQAGGESESSKSFVEKIKPSTVHLSAQYTEAEQKTSKTLLLKNKPASVSISPEIQNVEAVKAEPGPLFVETAKAEPEPSEHPPKKKERQHVLKPVHEPKRQQPEARQAALDTKIKMPHGFNRVWLVAALAIIVFLMALIYIFL